MKTLVLILVVCFVPGLALANDVASFTATLTTTAGSTGWPYKNSVCCVNGSGGVTFDCGSTAISATKGLIRNGQCIHLERTTSCGTLRWKAAAASTIDCYGTN